MKGFSLTSPKPKTKVDYSGRRSVRRLGIVVARLVMFLEMGGPDDVKAHLIEEARAILSLDVGEDLQALAAKELPK